MRLSYQVLSYYFRMNDLHDWCSYSLCWILDDLINQLSIQSDSSGFVEGDQLDVSLLSINDALTPSNRVSLQLL